jgi:manganese-dependent ADP-ribose/CDP-alcohol diphosphatase
MLHRPHIFLTGCWCHLLLLILSFPFIALKATAFSHTTTTTGCFISTDTMKRKYDDPCDEQHDKASRNISHQRRSARILRAHSEASVEQQEALPLLSMGVLADIQYAPIPDGYSFSGARRYYRHALETAKHAAQHFDRERLPVVLNLGDIVDGKCQGIARHGGEPLVASFSSVENADEIDPGDVCVDQVLEALSHYKAGHLLHVYGNHCLYNLDRVQLQAKLGIPFVQEPCGDLVGYTTHLHEPSGTRFVVLDSYDIALLHRCSQTSAKHQRAVELLRLNNPENFQANNSNSPEGLVGVGKRFVAFNGGVGPLQLEWLHSTLEQSRKDNERVIVVSHQPILPGSTNPVCLMWNYREVLLVLRQYSDVVLASFSGHAHTGGYQRDDKSGIHFRVFEAVLENPHPHKTYAMVDVHADRIHIRGFGNCKSAIYPLSARQQIPPKTKKVQQEQSETV